MNTNEHEQIEHCVVCGKPIIWVSAARDTDDNPLCDGCYMFDEPEHEQYTLTDEQRELVERL